MSISRDQAVQWLQDLLDELGEQGGNQLLADVYPGKRIAYDFDTISCNTGHRHGFLGSRWGDVGELRESQRRDFDRGDVVFYRWRLLLPAYLGTEIEVVGPLPSGESFDYEEAKEQLFSTLRQLGWGLMADPPKFLLRK